MAYDLIYNSLNVAERKKIEEGAFKPEVDFFTKDLKGWYDRIHNHNVWASAGVGIIGIASNNQDYIDIALKGSDKEAGDLAKAFNINGTDLESLADVTITLVNSYNAPQREVRSHKIARANKSIVTSAEFSTKQLIVEGVVGGDNDPAIAEQTWGSVLKLARAENFTATFDKRYQTVTYNGCNLYSTSTTRHGGFIEFVLTFEAADPIGLLGSLQLLQPNLATTATDSWSLTVIGDMPACPIISLSFSSVTGGTNKTVTVRNSDTGRGISVTRTWASSDVMEINCLSNEMTVNSGTVEYSGVFPTFENGEDLQYIDDFTARHTTISATYQPRIL
jgi:hypothetical protein